MWDAKGKHQRRHRLVGAAVAVTAVVLSQVIPAGAQTPEQDRQAAERAAAQIERTRDQAETAATALADAETDVAVLEDEVAQASQRLKAVENDLLATSEGVRTMALRRYTQGDMNSVAVISQAVEAGDQVRADFYLRFFVLGSNAVIDDYGRLREDAAREADRLAKASEGARRAGERLAAARASLDERLVALEQAEKVRQADATVRRIVEARRAEKLRQEQQVASAKAAREAQAALLTSRRSSAASPRPAAAAVRPATSPPPPSSGMTCPVAGASAFADTWGAARSGGRSHEGVDMMGARGTPIVAVVAGTAAPKTNRLGGNAVWLTGANGFTYYYAHLDSFAASGAVSPGTVIGYMGDTGNARGTVHLHFEVHPGGGRAVNPTPYARAAC